MANRTGYLYDHLYLEHELEPGHPESPLRLAALHATVSESGLLEKLITIQPHTDDRFIARQVALVHTEKHVSDVEKCGLNGTVALRAAGAVLAAVDAVAAGTMENGFCAIRPPGHHAHNDVNHDGHGQGEGFCFFNNVAIGARYAQTRHHLKNILIIDWDYHHGNGTEDAFYNDPTVFYFSTHRLHAYPGTGSPARKGTGRGTGYNLNIPLPAPDSPFGEVTDDHLLAAFERHLLPQLDAMRFVPDMIFISAGFDSREEDLLGDFSISDSGFSQLTGSIVRYAKMHCGGRIVSCLEGGYNPQGLALAGLAHIKALLETSQP